MNGDKRDSTKEWVSLFCEGALNAGNSKVVLRTVSGTGISE